MLDTFDETTITESPWAPDWIVQQCEKIKALPGKAAVLVNLEKQTKEWQDKILTPDAVVALRDRLEIPPYLLRYGTVVSSGVRGVRPFSHWLVHPNEGQWWSARELRGFGIDIPDKWQLRLYGVNADIYDQLIAEYL